MFCGQCGSTITSGTRFCPKCGNAVSNSPTETASSPRPLPTPQQVRPTSGKKVIAWLFALVVVFCGIIIMIAMTAEPKSNAKLDQASADAINNANSAVKSQTSAASNAGAASQNDADVAQAAAAKAAAAAADAANTAAAAAQEAADAANAVGDKGSTADAAGTSFPEAQRAFNSILDAACSPHEFKNPIQESEAKDKCLRARKDMTATNPTITNWNGVIIGMGAGDSAATVLVATTMHDLNVSKEVISLANNPNLSPRLRYLNTPGITYVAEHVTKESPVYEQLASMGTGDLITFSAKVRAVDESEGPRVLVYVDLTDMKPLKSQK